MTRRRRSSLAAAALLTLVTAACGSTGQAGGQPTTTSAPVGPTVTTASPVASSTASSPAASTTHSASPGPTSTGVAPPVDRVDKLLVFVVENHSRDQMRSQMPFTSSLADRYGYAADYTATTHPSLPNYLAIAGGDTFGVHDDNPPDLHPLTGASVFGEAIEHGRSARLYAEGMQRPCQTQSEGRYAVKHNPWAYFGDEATLCRRDDVPLSALDTDVGDGRLPAVGMVIPDLCDDAHDCPLSRADQWLRGHVTAVMSGPDWTGGHLAIVITADEDDDHHGNRILTVVASPGRRHRVVSTPLGHYALSRAYAEVAHVAPLRRAAGAADLLRSFGLAAS